MPERPTPSPLAPPILAALFMLAALSGCAGSRDGPYEAGYVPYNGVPPGPSGDPWGPFIRQAAGRFDVPEPWIRAVMRQESGGRPGATSRAGAMGLMQVMPGTYEGLRARYGLGPDPYHPRDNVLAGTAYLREMYEQFGSPHFLAAYNAGPNRLNDHLASGRELPWETQDYLARLAPQVAGIEPARRARPDAGTAYAAAAPYTAPAIRLRPPRAAVEPVYAPAAAVSAGLPEGVVISYVPDPDPADLAPPDPPAAPGEAFAPAPGTTLAPSPGGAFAPSPSGMDRARPIAPPQPAVWSRPPPLRPTPQSAPGTPGGWAVQVAALPSPTAARALADQAAGLVGQLGARAEVQPAPDAGLYRARVSGLTRGGAEAACARLRARGDCIVVPSPG